MKKIIIAFILITTFSCTKDEIFDDQKVLIKPELVIANPVGIKLETTFVTNEVSMNVKTQFNGNVIVKIFDITNKVVSKEEMVVKSGDNIFKVYTATLPPSAYRIGLFDKNDNKLGITDFNKL
jgi:hypothetical protein